MSAVEVFVALTLLSAGLTLSAQLVVRHQRLLAGQRQYRVALDELSNQIERLAALPAGELNAAITDLQPSELAKQCLPEVTLQGKLKSADIGEQLTLSIAWLERDQTAAPLSLSTWIHLREEQTP
jgi:hypothetical protein